MSKGEPKPPYLNLSPVVGKSGGSLTITLPPYYDMLLGTAEGAYEDSQYPIAVVVAQMAFEARVEDAFTTAYVATFTGEAPINEMVNALPDRSMMDRRCRELWQALTGDDIKKAPARAWPRYHQHVERRNTLAHGGLPCGKKEARASLDAVRDLVAHLDSVIEGMADRLDAANA
jgi:hypothetical protein